MIMGRLNWDALGIEWTFDYRANTFVKPYNGETLLNCPQDEVVITGVVQPMIITCESDYQEINLWFETETKLITCPTFYRAPVTILDVTSIYNHSNKSISWEDTPYKFTGVYFTGSNSNSNYNVLNPLLPVEWKVDICPTERTFSYHQPSLENPVFIEAIPFFVRPRLVN
jgi:hypothetical protein